MKPSTSDTQPRALSRDRTPPQGARDPTRASATGDAGTVAATHTSGSKENRSTHPPPRPSRGRMRGTGHGPPAEGPQLSAPVPHAAPASHRRGHVEPPTTLTSLREERSAQQLLSSPGHWGHQGHQGLQAVLKQPEAPRVSGTDSLGRRPVLESSCLCGRGVGGRSTEQARGLGPLSRRGRSLTKPLSHTQTGPRPRALQSTDPQWGSWLGGWLEGRRQDTLSLGGLGLACGTAPEQDPP